MLVVFHSLGRWGLALGVHIGHLRGRSLGYVEGLPMILCVAVVFQPERGDCIRACGAESGSPPGCVDTSGSQRVSISFAASLGYMRTDCATALRI